MNAELEKSLVYESRNLELIYGELNLCWDPSDLFLKHILPRLLCQCALIVAFMIYVSIGHWLCRPSRRCINLRMTTTWLPRQRSRMRFPPR